MYSNYDRKKKFLLSSWSLISVGGVCQALLLHATVGLDLNDLGMRDRANLCVDSRGDHIQYLI